MTKKSKKKRQENNNSQSVSLGNAISDNEAYSKTIDIREKRIGIVFKVIYVIAIFFAAVFMIVSENQGKGITDVYIIECAVAAFLLCLLYKMVVYIFNELKCLKLNHTDVPEKQIEKTERSYSRIFTYFTTCGMTSVFAVLIVGVTKQYITKEILALVLTISIINGIVIGNANFKKNKNAWASVSEMFWNIAFICAFVAMGLVTK